MVKPSCVVILFAMAFAFVGCASAPRYGSEVAEGTDLTEYETFGILPMPSDIPGADPGAALRVGSMLKTELREQLARRGYKHDSDGEAELAFAIKAKIDEDIVVMQRLESRRIRVSRNRIVTYPYRSVDVHTYKEGTISIEAYDAASDELVWVGWAQGPPRTGESSREKIAELVSGILSMFPTR